MTQKLTVTYKAPPGDAKVTEAYGHTFFDGKSEEIEVDDEVAAKIKGHPCFRTGGSDDAAKDKAHKGTDKNEKARA
jgi:hypothetical protein